MAEHSQESSHAESSNETSHQGSFSGRPREKKRVGFLSGVEPDDPHPKVISTLDATLDGYDSPDEASGETSGANTPSNSPNGDRGNSSETVRASRVDKSHLPELSPQQTQELHDALRQAVPIARPRPAIRRTAPAQISAADADSEDGGDKIGQRALRQIRQREAFERGKRLEEDERSVPTSRYNSPERKPGAAGGESIPLRRLEHEDTSDGDSDDPLETHKLRRAKDLNQIEAQRLVHKYSSARRRSDFMYTPPGSGVQSGAATPTEEQDYDYRPEPSQYRGGVLGALLRLYNHEMGDSSDTSRRSSIASTLGHNEFHTSHGHSSTSSPQRSPSDSGKGTPSGDGNSSHWFSKKHKSPSSSSLARLVGSSASLSTPVVSGLGEQVSRRLKEHREHERSSLGHRVKSSGAVSAFNRLSRPREDTKARITIHIAETLARQKYLMRLCRALMMYGAPTHRLEEYMKMSARVLEVEAQFLYIPGSMIMSFGDTTTHTADVKLVKVDPGLDLGKLRDVHEVYKEVVHDMISVDEAILRLKSTMSRPVKYNRWLRVPVYGLAAASVGPFAFSARLIDLPMAFVLGCILGILQLVVAPASELYANVFEVAATIILSFLSRALGSIPYKGGRLFCFSALAQSSIALILPGYIVLCASLELQSKKLVAGSVRMVYAIIYSLFLGFGLTVGIAIYGLLDKHATSEKTCSDPIPQYWFFFFVPLFTLCLAIINQAKWKQIPAMIVIAFAGYVANYFSAQRFAGNTQISSTIGALVIGVMANLYSRLGSIVEDWALDVWETTFKPRWRAIKRYIPHKHNSTRRHWMRSRRTSGNKLEEGVQVQTESKRIRAAHRVGYSLAAAAMLPAIFVQVPSGLGIEGSLVAGVASANQIVGNGLNGSTVVNSTTLANNQSSLNGIAFNVGYGVIQVAIGITVGLFLSAIVVYPVAKKRSGLFSF